MTSLEKWYSAGQPATDHTHEWTPETITDAEAIFTCSCGGRQRILHLDDEGRRHGVMQLDIPAKVEAQVESDLVNLLWGMTLGVAIVAALMGIAFIFTGRFWPE